MRYSYTLFRGGVCRMGVVNLRRRVWWPVVLVGSLVLAAFIYGVYRQEQARMAEELAHTMQAVEGYYQISLEERSHKLGATLAAIAADAEMRSALRAHDRDALLAWAMPVFRRLQADHNITHFYFHDARRVNILHVHQPERYGDTIERHTALRAERSGALAHGVELGPLGTFTLRAVLPVTEGGTLLGYLELGEEVDQVVRDMQHLFKIDLVVAIDKRYLRKEGWESGMGMLGRRSEWSQFPQRVVSAQTMDALPQELYGMLAGAAEPFTADAIELNSDRQIFRGRALPLQDAGERTVGSMIVLRDMTPHIQSSRNTLLLLYTGALALGAFLLAFFYRILGVMERRLESLLQRLRKSQAHLNHAQEISHLGSWELDMGNNSLAWSDEVYRIFEIDRTRFGATYEAFLDLVHPDDRDDVQRAFDAAMQDDKPYDIVHRLQMHDGRVKYVRELCEVSRAPDGKPLVATGTVHDVTDQQRAVSLAERMGRILEHSWNEIYTYDADTLRFVEVSDGACMNLGYSIGELREMTPLDLNAALTREQLQALLEPLRQGQERQVSFETEHRRKNGSLYPVEVRLQLIRSETPPVFLSINQDISERKRYIEELEHKAMYDDLTGLPNRSLLQDRLAHALKVARRDTSTVALLMVDVVRLREINDLLGHQNGDRVLQEVSNRLSTLLRESDTVARLGSDEFAVVLPSVDSAHVPTAVHKIQELFAQPVLVADVALEIEAAIGVALYPEHGDASAILIQHADIAMRVAKSEAVNYSVYNPEDDPYSMRRLKLHGELRQAIRDKTLALYYQPKVDIKRGTITSVEALARWHHPSEGLIPPDVFIPMVEQSGLIRPFTLWALEQAIVQGKRWIEQGLDLSVAVNLSTRNLLDPSLPDRIAMLLETHGVSAVCLELEVTESALMSRPESALKILTRLHEMGIRLAIDDYGTGYSSLAYLSALPIGALKIDQSFVKGMTSNDNDAIIVRSTIELAHHLGFKVIAEGVEDKDVLDLLDILDCDTAQGFYISRALPENELQQWLQDSPWGVRDDPQ